MVLFLLLQPPRSAPPPSARRRAVEMLAKGRKKTAVEPEYVALEPDGSDAWRADAVVRTIQTGGVGVMPTDTGYTFVSSVTSKAGVERILRLKGAADERKPLSLLCKDLATVDAYALGIDRPMFKLLKTYLPGPYTFILRASSKLPKQAYHDGKRQWKRSEIGVRIPGDPVTLAMLEQLDEPLLCSTVPSPDGEVDFNPVEWCSLDDADWCSQVDFVCDAGSRPVDGSTVYDLSAIADGEEPELLREGLGELIAA